MKYTGTFIGIILGIAAGFGIMYQIKTSQHSLQMTMFAIGISVVIFGFAGFSYGKRLDDQLQLEKDLGHDKLTENIVQQGRVWVAITEWTNKDGVEYALITGQTQDKTLISQLNKVMVYNHEIKSGSNVNVSKYHRLARKEIFEKQKREYKA